MSVIDEMEAKLLGCYIDNPDLFAKCQHLVSVNLFSTSVRKEAYKTIKKYHTAGIKPDTSLIYQELKKSGFSQSSLSEILTLSYDYKYAMSPENYVQELFELYVGRHLSPILGNAYSQLSGDAANVLEVMGEVKDAITKVELVINNVSKEKDIFEIFDEAAKRIDDLKNKKIERTGFSWGLTKLDKITGGIMKGVNVIAATSGGGKTTLLINVIKANVIDAGLPMLLFSIEMEALEIMTNIISNVTEINSRSLRTGNVDNDQVLTIKEVRNRLKSNFAIDDTGGITWQYFETKVKAFRKKHNIPLSETLLVALDYLQLMKNTPDEMKLSEEGQIGTRCNELARICKSENIALVEVSQFSRETGRRDIPKPRLSDLKGSGAIEMAAVLVLLLFRPEYHGIFTDDKGTNLRGLCEINPAKGRFVNPEPVYVKFEGKYSRFSDYDPDNQKEEVF